MGQENSVISDDTPPETLEERSLAAVADYIKSGRARRIVVMTGAGISTAAGIPDFRSPKTGLYSNLQRLKLPNPEAVFEISFFRERPEPFYVLAKELYPGKFHPTVSHVFLALLAHKGLLFHLFTQNIDCLERAAGVPEELIVEAHGSFATQRCIDCHTPYPDDRMKVAVESAEVPHCSNGCGGLVKPDIVFFGEQLPQDFRNKQHYPAMADLALVMGTSLQVQPFASLPGAVHEGVPRVLFNLERVGGIGSRADDVLELGDCDTGVRKLAAALGWGDELEARWRVLVGDAEAERQLKGTAQRMEDLQGEVDRLADNIDEVLHVDSDDSDNDEQPPLVETADVQPAEKEPTLLPEIEAAGPANIQHDAVTPPNKALANDVEKPDLHSTPAVASASESLKKDDQATTASLSGSEPSIIKSAEDKAADKSPASAEEEKNGSPVSKPAL